MLDVFLCHTAADRLVAEKLAQRLETGAEARVVLEECNPADGDSVANRWDGGLSSTAILLLLSPESVPSQPIRKNWEELLHHLEHSGEPLVGFLRLSDCRYPPMLERKRFFCWDGDGRDAVRAVERWLLSLHAAPAGPTFVPAALPSFTPTQEQLDPLWEALVDGSEVLRVKDPRIAQAFAKSAGKHFRDVVWVGCQGRTPVSIAGELGAHLGLSMECSAVEAAAKVGRKLDEHRVLVVLDSLKGHLPFPRLPQGRSSVLIVAAGELPSASVPDSPLWNAVACCHPNDFRIALPLRVAGADRDACRALMQQELIEPLDADGERFRRLKDSRNPLPMGVHTAMIASIFRDRHTSECTGLMAEFETALQWALAADWPLAVSLGQIGTRFLKETSRWPEAATLCKKLKAAAAKRLDGKVLDEFAWELSWIEDEPGRIRHAWSTHDQLGFEF